MLHPYFTVLSSEDPFQVHETTYVTTRYVFYIISLMLHHSIFSHLGRYRFFRYTKSTAKSTALIYPDWLYQFKTFYFGQ